VADTSARQFQQSSTAIQGVMEGSQQENHAKISTISYISLGYLYSQKSLEEGGPN